MSSTPDTTILLPGQQIGLAFVSEVAAASLCATGFLLAHFIYLGTSRSGRAKLARNPLNVYLISLFVADFIQAIGGFMDVLWVDKGRVYEGAYCSTQGALKQVGDVGVAFSILAITLHTTAQLLFEWDPPDSLRVPLSVVGCIWTFIILAVALGYGLHKHDPYYGNTVLWCWITDAHHESEQIALEYIWLWLTVGVNIAAFIAFLLVQCLRGPQRAFSASIVRRMALFPLVYMITVVPTSVARWIQFTTLSIPWRATIVSAVLFSSSGWLNVLLFRTARKGLFDDRAEPLMHAPPAMLEPHTFYPMQNGSVNSTGIEA